MGSAHQWWYLAYFCDHKTEHYIHCLCCRGSIPVKSCSFLIVFLSNSLWLYFMCSEQHAKYQSPRGFRWPAVCYLNNTHIYPLFSQCILCSTVYLLMFIDWECWSAIMGKSVKTEFDRDTQNMGFFSYLYYQYLLCSALYMLEPWERNLFRILNLLSEIGLPQLG